MDEKKDTKLIVGILTLGLALRLAFCWRVAVNMDEAWVLRVAALPLSGIFDAISGTPAMPLPLIIHHYWCLISTNIVWIQIPPIIFGLASIWGAYRMGAAFFERRTALAAAFFCAVSPALIPYSHYIRYPSMIVFLALVSAFCAMKAAGFGRKEQGAGDGAFAKYYIIHAVSMVCCIYSHYFMFVWLGGLNVFFLLFARGRRVLLRWGLTQIIILISFIPWLPNMIINETGSPLEFTQLGIAIPEALKRIVLYIPELLARTVFGDFINIYADAPVLIAMKIFVAALILLGAAGFLRGVMNARPDERRAIWAISCMIVSTCVFGVAATALIPGVIFILQYYLFMVPFVLLLLSFVVTADKSGLLRISLAVVVCALLFAPLAYRFHLYAAEKNMTDVMAVLNSEMKAGDVVLVEPNTVEWAVLYYIKKPLPVHAIPDKHDFMRYTQDSVCRPLTYKRFRQLQKDLGKAKRVWFFKVESNYVFDQNEYMRKYFEKGFREKHTMRFVESYPMHGTMTLYEKKK